MKKNILIRMVIIPILAVILLYISIVLENENLRIFAASLIAIPVSTQILRLFKKYIKQ